MEGNVNKSKARLIILSIFVIGFAAGALSMNLYERLMNTKSPDEYSGKPHENIVRKMDQRLGLTTEQETQIKTILEETFAQYKVLETDMKPLIKDYEPKFAEVKQKSRDRIRSILSEKQLPEFEKMVAEHDKRREENKK